MTDILILPHRNGWDCPTSLPTFVAVGLMFSLVWWVSSVGYVSVELICISSYRRWILSHMLIDRLPLRSVFSNLLPVFWTFYYWVSNDYMFYEYFHIFMNIFTDESVAYLFILWWHFFWPAEGFHFDEVCSVSLFSYGLLLRSYVSYLLHVVKMFSCVFLWKL